MDFNLLSTAIDVNLYKYNHLDNQIWTRIKNEIDYVDIQGLDSILVSSDQLRLFLETHYSKTINKIRSVGAEFLHKEVTTPWFLTAVLSEMEELKYIKFNLNCDKKYTRLLEVDGDKMVKFDFKVLSLTINLYDFFTESELTKVNDVLIKLGIFEPNVPYARLKINELLNKIDIFISNSFQEEENIQQEADLLSSFMDLVDEKIERDDPLVLLVTDY